MARSLTIPTADDLFDLMAKLPWWVGASVAAVSFAALNGAAQVVLPTLGLSVALGSVIARRKRGVTVPSSDILDGITRREFEALMSESFRRQGYQLGEGTPEGADLVLRKDRQTWLVHCAPWRAAKVDVDVVKAFASGLATRGAAGGFIVSSGRFTREAIAFTQGTTLHLVDGPALQLRIKQVRPARSVVAAPVAPPTARPVVAPPASTVDPAPRLAPLCPKCASGMIHRKVKRGEHAGLEFWGCVMHPQCRGIRKIPPPSP
ncbi:MAG: restriction endonuclease [Burkholderiales bacterium]